MSAEISSNQGRWHLAGLIALTVTGICIYANVGQYGFSTLDDPVYITQNQWVQEGISRSGILWAFTDTYASNWHPLTWLSHMLDTSLFGTGAGPRHQVSVAIHVLNAWLLYLLVQQLFGRVAASLAAGLMFVAHPLHVESVVWISERKDVLCGFFVLAALNTYVVYVRECSPRWYAATLLLFLLALMSKPMAVSFPIQLMLLDWLIFQRLVLPKAMTTGWLQEAWQSNRRWVLEKVPFLLLSLAVGLITLLAQDQALTLSAHLDMRFRLMNVTLSYVTYLKDFLLPNQLAPLYPVRNIDPLTEFLPALVVLLAIVVGCVALRRRTRWPLFALLWYLITLLPVIGLLHVGAQSHADRYMYLPAIGIYLCVAAGVAAVHGKHRRLTAFILAPVVIFFATLAWIQTGYWSNPHSLWSRSLEVGGHSRTAHTILYSYYLENDLYERAMEHAAELSKRYPDTSAGPSAMGWIEYRRGRYVQAADWFRTAVRREVGVFPVYAYNLQALAISLEQLGQSADALRYYRLAVEQDPNLVTSRRAINRLTSRN